jgi:hypothetical protein
MSYRLTNISQFKEECKIDLFENPIITVFLNIINTQLVHKV